MDLKSILSNLNICQDVIKLILQYNATLLGFVARNDGSICVQDYQTKKQLNVLQIDAYDNRYKYFHSKMLILPEFHWVLRVQGGKQVRIWDLNTPKPFYSQSVADIYSRVYVEFMFWVPQLRKLVLIDAEQIYILTVEQQTKQVRFETIHPIEQEKESKATLSLLHAEPELLDPFRFRLIYRIYPRNDRIHTILKTFNVKTKQLECLRMKKPVDSIIQQIWPVTKTASLVMIVNQRNGEKSLVMYDRQSLMQYPVYIDGSEVLPGSTLVDCVHILDFSYKLMYRENSTYLTFKSILHLKDDKYWLVINGISLQPDFTQATLLSEHHYCETSYNNADGLVLGLILILVFVFGCACVWRG